MRKTIKIFFLSLVISFFFLPTKVDAFSGSGSGTEGSPYVITTCAQLQEMNLDLDGYYELGNDIDCSATSGWSWAGGTGFQPVGGLWGGPGVPVGATQDVEFTSPVAGPVFSFQGTLDGKGYEISDLEGASTVPYGALFGVTNHAVITNLTLTNPNCTSGYLYGSLIAYGVDTEITNVDVVLDLDGASAPADYSDAGVIAAYLEGSTTTLRDVNVSGYLGTDTNMGNASGGLIGTVIGDVEIIDSSSSLIIDFSGAYGYGCAVGYFSGDTDGTLTIDNFESTCSIDTGAGGAIGGVVGRTGAASGHLGTLNISDSSFDGQFITNGSIWAVSGIVGYAAARTTGSIDNCDSDIDFDMTGVANQTGGLVGAHRTEDDFNITDSRASGSIDVDAGAGSPYLLGGLVGASNHDMIVEQSSSSVAISVSNTDYTELVGGIAGRLGAGSEINNCSATGDISIATIYDESPAYAIGGIVGAFNLGSATVNNSYYVGEMLFTGYNTSFTGGIAGAITDGEINNCFADVTITSVEGDWGDYAIGGVCGGCDGTVSGSVAYSVINTGIDGYTIGGLVGYSDSVVNSYADTTITAMNGVTGVGGLAGVVRNSGDSISNAYATGTINLADTAGVAGGLVGRMVDGTSATNAYSNTVLNLGASSADYGGLVGHVDPAHTATVTNSYWNQTVSGIGVSARGTAYSDAQMKVQGNFNTWDFDNIWAIDSGTNDGYPYFGYYETSMTPSQTGSSSYSRSYNIDLSFENNWPLSSVRYQWSTGLAPVGSNWTTITSYNDLPSPEVTGGRYLHVNYQNILGYDGYLISNAFLLDNNPPTVAVDEGSNTVSILVTEEESGISVVQYFWSQTTSAPSGGWQDSSEGDDIDKPTEEGTWYLHVRSLDNAGNLVLGISDAFEISGSTTPVYYNPVVPINDPGDKDDDDDEDQDKDDVIIDQPSVTQPVIKEPEVETSRAIGEILSAFVEEPIVRTSILATGVTSSMIILSPSFWLNWSLGLWERILSLFGVFVRKKDKRTGVVYDSRTKEPIKLAVVRFFDKEDRLITTEVTDAMGSFSFEYDGEYRIEVSARRYSFPSSLIKGSDSVYANVYSDGYIQNEEVSIPLDENENGLIRATLVFLANRVGVMVNILCWLLFILGFSLVIYNMTGGINTENIIWFSVYLILLFTSFVSLKKTEGQIYSAYGESLSGYKVILRDKTVNSVSYQRMTNEEGRYRFVVPEGEYTLQVLNASEDVVFSKDILDVRVRNGLITVVEDIII